MDNLRLILFGAAFTGLTSLCLGLLIVQCLRLPLHRREARLFGFLLGAAALNLAVFLSTAMWMAKPWWFATLGGVSIAAAVWRRVWRYGVDVPMAPLQRRWKWIFAAGLLVYGVFTLAHAMAPEISPDGASYHLGTVSRYLRDGGFAIHTTNMYANLPMGVEMLFLFAFAFGKGSAAALVHWQFYILLPFLLAAFGSRFGFPKAGAMAGLLVLFSPVVALDGSSAYVDAAAGTVAFGLMYLLMVWERERNSGLTYAIGMLAGYCYACKMTVFAAVPFAVGFVVWKSWRSREPWLRRGAMVALVAAVLISPWLVKNAVIVGNPFSPFLNKWFPNPNIKVSFEEEYRTSFRDYHGAIKSPLEIPLEVTTGGARLNGLLGPIFLLAPIALFALRWPVGRRVLLAAAVFLAAYPSNIGTRFLLTALPFVAFAMGMVLSNWRGAGVAVVVAHAFFSWPGVISAYCHEHAWRMNDFRWKAALRLQKEESFLLEHMFDYRMARLIEQQVPQHGKVLAFSGIPEAYTTRDVLVVYQSGFGNMLGDIWIAGMAVDAQPTRAWEYRFAPRQVRRLRLVQTKERPENWTLAELRVLNKGSERERDSAWRVRANPNPWEVQTAFDNCPMTRWNSWQKAEPGMFVEIDFGRPLEVSEVRVEASPAQATSARVEGETSPGHWETLAKEPEIKVLEPVENARRIATDDLKRLGITHLLTNNGDFTKDEMIINRLAWGVTLVGEVPSGRLYRID